MAMTQQNVADDFDCTPRWRGKPPVFVPCGAVKAAAANGIEVLLTSDEAGVILGLHPKVVERKAKKGEIPAFKLGKYWRYRASTLDGWIESQLHSACQPCRTATSF